MTLLCINVLPVGAEMKTSQNMLSKSNTARLSKEGKQNDTSLVLRRYRKSDQRVHSRELLLKYHESHVTQDRDH